MSAHPAATRPVAGLPPRDDPHLMGRAEARDTARQGHPQGRAPDDRETRMSKGDGARLRATDSPMSATAEPEFVQLLTPTGERVEHPEYDVDFTDEEFRGLYRDLVVVRKLDAEATALQRQGELGIWASLLGQEAAQVGSGRALRTQDMAFPTYREHGVLYCRGIDPIMPLSLFRGVDQGAWDSVAHKFNMYTIVIGAQTLGRGSGGPPRGRCRTAPRAPAARTCPRGRPRSSPRRTPPCRSATAAIASRRELPAASAAATSARSSSSAG